MVYVYFARLTYVVHVTRHLHFIVCHVYRRCIIIILWHLSVHWIVVRLTMRKVMNVLLVKSLAWLVMWSIILVWLVWVISWGLRGCALIVVRRGMLISLVLACLVEVIVWFVILVVAWFVNPMLIPIKNRVCWIVLWLICLKLLIHTVPCAQKYLTVLLAKASQVKVINVHLVLVLMLILRGFVSTNVLTTMNQMVNILVNWRWITSRLCNSMRMKESLGFLLVVLVCW